MIFTHLLNNMAAEEQIEPNEEENTKENKSKRMAKHNDGAAELENVTDYAEEVEISQNIGEAMKVLGDKSTKEITETIMKEKELSEVKINKEDVDLIVQEMEVTRTLAERKLCEHKGNVVDAAVELTN